MNYYQWVVIMTKSFQRCKLVFVLVFSVSVDFFAKFSSFCLSDYQAAPVATDHYLSLIITPNTLFGPVTTVAAIAVRASPAVKCSTLFCPRLASQSIEDTDYELFDDVGKWQFCSCSKHKVRTQQQSLCCSQIQPSSSSLGCSLLLPGAGLGTNNCPH